MEAVVREFFSKGRSGKYTFVPLGDMHVGSKAFDRDKFMDTVDYIKNKPDCYWWGMGDYSDMVLPGDKRFDPSSIEPQFLAKLDDLPNAYTKDLVKMLSPIKDRCLGLLSGNHEDHVRTKTHLDVASMLAFGLGVQHLGYVSLMRLRFYRPYGKKNKAEIVDVFMGHGNSGGGKTGRTVDAVEELAKFWDADIYCMGHSHKKTATSGVRVGLPISSPNPEWKDRKLTFVNTGTFHRSYTHGNISYSELKMYPPLATGCMKINIEPWRNIRGKNVQPNIHCWE